VAALTLVSLLSWMTGWLVTEIDADSRCLVQEQGLIIEMRLMNRNSEAEDFDLPAGMTFRTRGEKTVTVLALEPLICTVPPNATLEIRVPAVALNGEIPQEVSLEPYFDSSLAQNVKLVFSIHELAKRKQLKSSPQRIAPWALQVHPIGGHTLEEVLSRAPSDIREDLQKSLTFFVERFPQHTSRGEGQDRKEVQDDQEVPFAGFWYTHALGHYRVCIPEGWRVILQHRETIPDTSYDTVQSTDGRYVLGFSRLAREVGEPDQAMERFKQQILSDIQDRDNIRILIRPIAGHKAMSIGYVSAKGKWGFWIIAIFHEGRRYVINAKFPHEEYGEDFPGILRQILETFTFRTW